MIYRFASFNIRNSTAADGPDSWVHRSGQVLDLLRYYAWDAVGFQELTGVQKDAVARLPGYAHEGISRDNDNNGEHCSVFYRTDRFERVDGGTFWLSPTPEVPLSVAWGSACIRICTWVLLRDKRNGRSFAFVNTHLDHISEEARAEGAKVVLERIKNQFAEIPVVLTGDFNATPEERCYRDITAVLTDTRRAAGALHYGPSGTFHGFRPDAASWGNLHEIDYIFVSRDIATLKTRTIADRDDRGFPSDHFPIDAEVDIP